MSWGLALDVAARLATGAGYQVGDCVATLLDMIRDEIFGHRHVAIDAIAIEQELDTWAAFHADLYQHTEFDIPYTGHPLDVRVESESHVESQLSGTE